MFDVEKGRLKDLVPAYWRLDRDAQRGPAGEAILTECEQTYDRMLDAGLEHPLEPEFFIYPEVSSPRYEQFAATYEMTRTFPNQMLLFLGKRIHSVYRLFGAQFVNGLDSYPEPFRWTRRRR
jgi:hypothetical protein